MDFLIRSKPRPMPTLDCQSLFGFLKTPNIASSSFPCAIPYESIPTHASRRVIRNQQGKTTCQLQIQQPAQLTITNRTSLQNQSTPSTTPHQTNHHTTHNQHLAVYNSKTAKFPTLCKIIAQWFALSHHLIYFSFSPFIRIQTTPIPKQQNPPHLSTKPGRS